MAGASLRGNTAIRCRQKSQNFRVVPEIRNEGETRRKGVPHHGAPNLDPYCVDAYRCQCANALQSSEQYQGTNIEHMFTTILAMLFDTNV